MQKETIKMPSMENVFRFGDATCFYFQRDHFFVSKWLTKKNFQLTKQKFK